MLVFYRYIKVIELNKYLLLFLIVLCLLLVVLGIAEGSLCGKLKRSNTYLNNI